MKRFKRSIPICKHIWQFVRHLLLTLLVNIVWDNWCLIIIFTRIDLCYMNSIIYIKYLQNKLLLVFIIILLSLAIVEYKALDTNAHIRLKNILAFEFDLFYCYFCLDASRKKSDCLTKFDISEKRKPRFCACLTKLNSLFVK